MSARVSRRCSRWTSPVLVATATLICSSCEPESEPLGPRAGREQRPAEFLPPELLKLGRYEEAEQRLREVLAAGIPERSNDPKDSDISRARVHHLLALALSGQGRFEEALEEIREAVRHAGDNPEVQRAYANILLKGGRPADAVERYRGAIRLADQFRVRTGLDVPDLHRWRYEFAQALLRAGRREEAARELAAYERSQSTEMELRALERQTEDRQTPAAHCEYARALREAGKLQESAQAYRSAIATDGRFVEARLGLASTLIQDASGRTDPASRLRLLGAAWENVRFALGLQPSAEGHLVLARIARMQGNAERSEKEIEAALELAPDDTDLQSQIEGIRQLHPGER